MIYSVPRVIAELHKSSSTRQRVLVTSPLLVPVAAFCAGIAVDCFCAPMVLLLGIWILVAAIGVVLFRGMPSWRLLFVCALACGAGAIHHAQAVRFLPADHIRRWAGLGDPTLRPQLEGVVLTASVTNWSEKAFPYHVRPYIYTCFTVRARRVSVADTSTNTCGLVRVVLPGIHDQYRPGTTVTVKGRLAADGQYIRWPGILENSRVIRSDPNAVRMNVSVAEDIVTGAVENNLCGRAVAWLRRSAQVLLVPDGSAVSPDTRSLLSTMVLGQRYKIEDQLNQDFIASGAAHFLSVSGFHLGILASAVWCFSLAGGLSRRNSAWLVLAVIWLYVAITEVQPPIVRSAIMATLACLALLTKRPSNSLNWLAAAALIILLVNPNQLFSVGFELSFVCVLGMILLYRPIYSGFFGLPQPVETDFSSDPPAWAPILWRWLRELIKLAFSVSVAAWVASLPIVMLRFGMLSAIGPLTTVLIYPLTVVMIVLSFVQLLIAGLIGWAPLLPLLLDTTSRALAAMVKLLASLPGASFPVLPPPVVLIVGYYVLLIWAALSRAKTGTHLPRSGWGAMFSRLMTLSPAKTCFLALLATYLTYWTVCAGAFPGQSASSVELIVANRATGQSVAVRSGRQLWLIDGGAGSPNDIVRFVNDLKVKYLASLKAVVLSFPEQRYFNDLPQLASGFPDAGVFAGSGFAALRDKYDPARELFERNILADASVLKPGQSIHSESCRLTLLYPSREVADKVIGLKPLPEKMSGTGMLKQFCELGGVVLVETPSGRAVVGSMLGPIGCEFIENTYPDLRAGVLVIYAKSPTGAALERFIRQIGARHVVVCDRLSDGDLDWYRQTCRRLGVTLTSVKGGCVTIPIEK